MARPRKYPSSTTPAERQAARRAALAAQGGALVHADLSPEEARKLTLIREALGEPTTAATIRRLIADWRPR